MGNKGEEIIKSEPAIATADLPITEVLDDLGQTLASHPGAVLRAPPGAGKTTLVPLYLRDADWLQKRTILVLAPRRMAARAAANRMSRLLGEKVGRTVGYRVRMETQVGPETRIEVITEGVLTTMLQNDPSLNRVGLVIFDEFHERSLDADLGMALCLDIQGVLNTDLKLLVMSATMETGPVADMLGKAPVIDAQGRTFPIETRYVGTHTPTGDMAAVTRAIRSAAEQESGSILVFLPGAAEIRQVAARLERSGLEAHWRVMPLLGSLSSKAQDRAILPAPQGYRKIVLATAIAETSLTIEGIRVVVDCGLQRVPRFDPGSGMSRLVTLPVSRASADQRRGRAGRLGPGICLRLWSQAMHATLAADRRPEIMEADLCALALELAGWGVARPEDLKWLDPPPAGAYAAACELLQTLEALDPKNKITPHGRQMATMPVHPRLAHMLLMARRSNQTQMACDLAALLSERDPVRFESGRGDVDLQLRYDLLQARRNRRSFAHPAAKVNYSACDYMVAVADRLRHRLAGKDRKPKEPCLPLGGVLAWAYPDRIARRRPGERGRYLTRSGQGLRLDETDPMAAQDFIVAVEADGQRRDGRIFRAAAYDAALLEEQFSEQLQWRESIQWDGRRQSVSSQQELRFGALALRTKTLARPDERQVLAAMVRGIHKSGMDVLPWTKSLRNWQARVCFLHRIIGDAELWPDLSDQNLAARLDQWLPPFLSGMTRLRDLSRVDLRGALLSLLPYDGHRQLDALAPTHCTVPSGSRIPIDYGATVPVLAVRLQELFGLDRTPVIAGGRQPLLLHLLSPASRPVQVTQDLSGFWKHSYHEVKKELKGRYPKHHWPDDPLTAQPTARAKPRK
ncbi:MAG: ATP-dependent helicase HrpB [Desulfobacteraceae bacterium]|jgi:ATP-dependent helicase HrpB